MQPSHMTVYDLIGGEPVIRQLVDGFYARVEADPALRPLFPEDMSEGKRYQFLFLCQFFGGPQTYSAERGHPRMKQRHMPFAIGRTAREAWLSHMLASLDDVGIEEPMRTIMRDYFVRASEHMMNQAE